MNILYALCGVLLHIAMKLAKFEKSGKKFVWKTWLAKNKFQTILSVLGAIVLGAFVPDLSVVAYIGVGYATDSALKNLFGK